MDGGRILEIVQGIGLWVRSNVLWGAGLLRGESAPGLVSLALLVVLALSLLVFVGGIRSRVRALVWLDRAVRRHGDEHAFSAGLDRLTAEIERDGRRGNREKVAGVWREFSETLIVEDGGGRPIYRNSVRPAAFFNLEDMGFGVGFWRHVPSLFVSVGLFLTFLGLVSALDSMVTESGGSIGAQQMNDLLSVASAKFIMSLTGLFCSIVFTIALRRELGVAEDRAHRLCDGLEKRLSFLSLEGLAARQLKAVIEQRDMLKSFATELVAELGRPLKEMPAAISGSIEQTMRPLLDQVGRAGTDGVGALVQDISSRMTEDVGRALGEASRSIQEAGDRIARLSERMDQSSSKVGDELNIALTRVSDAVAGIRDTLGAAARETGGTFSAGAERLLAVMNQTLEGIRDNTSAGAAAMSAAAADLRQAGERVRAELEAAGRAGAAAADREIGRVAAEASAKAASAILAPLDQIADKMAGVAGQVAAAGNDMRLFADGVKSGADASAQASASFRTASQDLTAAAAPIRASVASVESSLAALSEATRAAASTVSRSAEATARAAAETLATAQAVLGSEQKAIENALGGIDVALRRLREQGERIDDIDDKLGRAFAIYTQQVAGAVDGMRQHVQHLQQTLQPSLDTLKSVVESAEEFIPKSRVR
ncbi:hypothetical protein [Prosthecomicrobium pneumaticum]|uniref:ABC-type transporter Mla subunit MlaD n=1 Tax=Prosthecomicrobium pneumaticum TaxID=81895 RepID=A0A7W9FMD6_9HYPH|nr:hypothetical protein [Prosthecomicrobium pneumaticum]MBB5753357.1 ABC-type transporter Mla subunit MlaD [Prosthecomicrobium pneumaticum]